MPRILGPIPFDTWERRVRDELQKRLPEDWVVVSNVGYQWQNSDGYTRDGQADFVVLVPGLGLAVVEVKGTKKIWVGDDGNWYKITKNNSRLRLKEPPPEQATRNMHNISSRVAAELGKNSFPGLFGWLVVYPNGEVLGKLDTYLQSSVLTKSNLHQIKHAIENVIRERGKEKLGGMFTESYAKQAAKILTNANFIVKAVDTEIDVEEEGDSIDMLTRQQFAALRGAFELPDVSIVGPAGSGKTILAMWKLKALIDSGTKVLFVCFNRPLAEFLKLNHEELSDHIVNVDKFFLELANTRRQEDKDFFSKKLPDLVLSRLFDMSEEEKYDAIIVDEGQDFGDDRLTALKFLLRESGTPQWLVFSDQRQNLFQAEQEADIQAEVTFRLYHNCRNTKKLNLATNSVFDIDVRSMPGVPDGVKPNAVLCRREHMAQKTWDLIRQLSPEGGAVILSPFTLDNSCLKESTMGHGLELTTDINHLGKPGSVFFSTIRSFKGLEAGHVIFIHADVPGASKALSKEDIYVAFTRATTRLDVLTSKQEAKIWYESAIDSLR